MSTSPAPLALELHGLAKSFGPKVVLDGVDLSLAQGRSLVVLGPSGTGKSVMLKCALGLISPDRGTIKVMGQDATGLTGKAQAKLRRHFGMLFQGSALFDSLRIWENIAFQLLYADGVPRAEARAQAIATMAETRLPADAADRFPSELSGGMQKRAALARAIIAKPDILFFDEPTTGLDPITADAINDLIRDRVRALGCAALSITHDLASARKIADEVALLYQGKILWRGPVEDIDRSGNPAMEQFLAGRADGPIQPSV